MGKYWLPKWNFSVLEISSILEFIRSICIYNSLFKILLQIMYIFSIPLITSRDKAFLSPKKLKQGIVF